MKLRYELAMGSLRHTVLALVFAGCGGSAPAVVPIDDDADADAGPDAAADAGAPFHALFDGTSLAGWDRWLGTPYAPDGGTTAPLGLENDPHQVFSVTTLDGEPAIHVTGETFGALVSKEEYGDFELSLQYKWGARTWPPLNGRDSGVMVLSTGAFGAVNAGGDALSDPIGSGGFLVSVEFQVASGDIGGLYNLGPITIDAGPRTQVAEIPDAWNTIRIVVHGSASEHYLNGQLVAQASGYALHLPGQPSTPLARGKIQLQSEGGEIYFRHVEVRDSTRP